MAQDTREGIVEIQRGGTRQLRGAFDLLFLEKNCFRARLALRGRCTRIRARTCRPVELQEKALITFTSPATNPSIESGVNTAFGPELQADACGGGPLPG